MKTSQYRFVVAVLLTGVLALPGAFPVNAALAAPALTFTVNSTADTHDASPGNGICADGGGHCTLRAAVEEANALAGDDTITLPAGTYGLTLDSYINVTTNVTVNGAGRTTTILNGSQNDAQAFRVASSGRLALNDLRIQDFDYMGAIDNEQGTVVIDNCAVSDNYHYYGNGTGGAIENRGGVVTISSSTLSVNRAAKDGGAIYNDGGTVTISWNTILSGNEAIGGPSQRAWGGAIYSSGGNVYINNYSEVTGNQAYTGGGAIGMSGGTLTIFLSQVSGNTVDASGWDGGGAIYSHAATVTIENTLLANNDAPDNGGAIFIEDSDTPASQVTIVDSSLTGNTTSGNGGAISVLAPTSADVLRLTNSTVSGNESDLSGGGLYINGGVVRISSATIVSNTAAADGNNTSDGGGIFVAPASTVNLQNTILAHNTDASSGFAPIIQGNCRGALVSGGYNLIALLPGLCTISGVQSGNRIGTVGAPIDPRLGSLDDSSYWTAYHPLFRGSLAVDGGNPSGCTDHAGALLGHDQRGETRPMGTACDIGAVESSYRRWRTFLPLVLRGE